MTMYRGLWVPINTGNVGTTELEARLAMAGLFASNNGTDPRSGVLLPSSATIVTGMAATSPMSYSIANLVAVINRVSGEGAYQFANVGPTTVTTTAAPGANSRYDLIWVKQNDQSKGDANNLAIAGVTQGTVSATPSIPAAPTGCLPLAAALITSTTTNTAAATITQVFPYAALKGTPVKVRNTTERATITTPQLGDMVQRLDLTGQPVEQWNGTAWVGTDYSPVNTTDGAWTYRGGLYRDSSKGVPKVCLTLLLTRTGSSVALTTTPIQAFAGLIPAGWRPIGHSVTSATVIQTSAGADKWGMSVRIEADGDTFFRTDTGSSSVAVNEMVPIHMEWVQ